ncbi:MAG: Ig-like domain-containing protein [Candidatus Peribacteraceae bacterium]|nr:Ig-like domain-containing protein [Candidatus Peribacteraceae bacterium]
MTFSSLRGTRVIAGITFFLIVFALLIGSFFMTRSPKIVSIRQHQRIAAVSPFRLAFAEEMDHASVEENLTLPSDVQAVVSWVGEELVLQPKSKLTEKSTYVVTVGGAAKKSSGQTLGADMDFTFIVAGAPVVSARIPAPDAKNIAPNTDIVIVFDRPVVPLTQVQGDKAVNRWKDWPVTVDPPLKGRWRWLGTTTASFEIEEEMTEATAYNVSVPKGIAMINGEATEEDFTWTFETERPRVLYASPTGSLEGPTSVMSVQFNHEMDLAAAEEFITIAETVSGPSAKDAPSDASKPTAFPVRSLKFGTKEEKRKTVQDRTQVIVVPAKPLQFNRSYVMTVAAGLRGKTGNLGTAEPFTSQFSTVGEFRILSGDSEGTGRLHFSFTAPPDPQMLTGSSISITPAIPTWKSTSCSVYGAEANCYPLLNPSTDYSVTVNTTLKDQFGQSLKNPLTFKFRTPPITPEAFIFPRGKEFNIFEQSRPPVFYLNHVNVSALDVEVARISLESFRKIRFDRRNSGYSTLDLTTVSDDVRSWHIESLGKQDAWTIKTFDLQERLKDAPSGIYMMTLRAPEWKDWEGKPQVEQRFFALTDFGVTLKYSGQSALVWVTDLQTGDPVQGATVTFSTLAGTTPVTGKTDNQGFFESNGKIGGLGDFSNYSQPEFWVTVEKEGKSSFVASTWNNGFQPYDFPDVYGDFLSPAAPRFRLQSMIYTERPLYRAGDTVEVKGTLRFLDPEGVMHLPSKGRTVSVTVTDSEQKTILEKSVSLTSFGTFTLSVPLAKEASLGWYGITASVVPGNDVQGSAYGNFSVEAYRKPEYRVSAQVGRDQYMNRDTLTGSVTGEYYFGAPMAGAAVKWYASYTDYYFSPSLDEYYSFSDSEWCYRDCERKEHPMTEGEGTLDATGRFRLSIPLSIDEYPVSQVIGIGVDLTDENNQVVSTNMMAAVHKTGVYVGVRSDDYSVASGKEATVNVITLHPDGSPAPKREVTVSLYKRTWNVVQEKGVDGEYYYDSKPDDTFISDGRITTDEKGKARAAVLLPDGGQYHVTVTAKDDDGRASKAGWDLYAWSDTYVNWPHSNNDRIEIIADKEEYKPGDTAKLLVKTPYQGKGVKALVTVERENIISKKIIDVTSNALPIDIPITGDLLPTAYVSVVIMKPRMGETFDANGKDTGTPAFKVGYVKLPIDISSKKLSVTIETDKKRYLPRETVTVRLKTLDASGKPARSELSLSVVDMSLLDLTGYATPDILSSFYTQRGLGVITANMLTHLVERFKPGSKGGGGGDSEGIRGDFRDTAYWNPSIITDGKGEATVTFQLPDNLTTWHLEALGSTTNHLFGSQSVTVIETKNVIVRPVRPRFAVIGDRITLGAIVRNGTTEAKTFDVTLSGSGFTQKTGKQTVTVPAEGQIKVNFPVVVSDAPSLTMRFAAITDDARDIIEETVPLERFGTVQTNATAGMTEDRIDEKAFIPSKADAESGSLTVQVAPSLGMYLPKALSYLVDFPYGCAEQITSSLLPNVALKQLQQLGAFKIVDDKTLEKNVVSGMQKLYAFQRSDGGFGYWEGSGDSYPSLTAYIVSAFREAKTAGYGVDSGVINRAVKYLQNALHDLRPEKRLSLAERVHILYVLGEEGVTDLPALNDAYDKRIDLPVFSRAELAMAFDHSGGSREKTKARELLTEVMNSIRVDARGAHFEDSGNYWYLMHSGDRATAIVLRAAVRIDPENPFVWKLVRAMLASRHDGRWDTTQSTALSILSLVEYLKQTEELESSYTFTAAVDSATILSGTVVPTMLKQWSSHIPFVDLPREKEVDIAIAKEGKGRLYYDLLLQYFYTPEEIQPAEEGIGILRETMPLNALDKEPLKAGSVRKVRLTITVPETRHFVAVESMLAAGYEAIDLQYATAQQHLSDELNSSNDYYRNQSWRFSHVELRDDRVFLFADELPSGVYRYEYLVRATTPGTFHERPARVWEMYFPETFGQTGGGWLTIGE